MTIAADPRYRSVRLVFDNNDARGNENVQLYAKALGGDWALARTFAVAGAEQETTWDTALPVTAYDIAFRYVSGNVPAVGYEGTPDAWTAPTAAGSKSTVNTTSAAVAWGAAPSFVNAATPINLVWSSAQQDVPYLLEKDVGAGFVTVVSGLVATSYQYTIPGAELGTTVTFRVTARRGAVVGTTAGTLAVPMFITVGQPTWASATFSPATRVAALAWNAASNATTYLLEKNAGAGWTTVATLGATSYNYPVPDAEINTTVQFRVTGQNGATSGTVSATQNLAMTIVVGASVLSGGSWSVSEGSVSGLTWTAATNATAYRIEADWGSGYSVIATTSLLVSGTMYVGTGYSLPLAALNVTVNFRIVATNGAITGVASNVVGVATPLTIPSAPGALSAVKQSPSYPYGVVVSWTASTGDVSLYAVYLKRSGSGSFGLWGFTAAPGLSFTVTGDGPFDEAYVIATAAQGRIPGGQAGPVVVT